MMVSSFHDGRSQAVPVTETDANPYSQQQRIRRKRKADTQDTNNERLSKRLSLLNLEHNGSRLYVPVEQTQLDQPPTAATATGDATSTPLALPVAGASAAGTVAGDEMMHLDDTSHKVYIYNLDDELSSESEPDDPEGRLVFLPDVERHLRANRIVPGARPGAGPAPSVVPRPILPNRDGELAGMQLVLYDEGPSSLTVPEEHDSVRKAIAEARARVRQRQLEEREAREVANNPLLRSAVPAATATFATPVRVASSPAAAVVPALGQTAGEASGMAVAPPLVGDVAVGGIGGDDGDADAMDID